MFWAGRYVIDLKIKLHGKNTTHSAEREWKGIIVFAICKTEN